jgi:osmoprotectant transport system permease protein
MDRYTASYLERNWRLVVELAIDHLVLSLQAVALALVVAIPLGILATRFPRLGFPIVSVLGALYTVPSLAFLAFLIPTLGLGRDNALVVLAAYAQIFLVRNIVAGLRGVDPAALEAASGMGMNAWQVFARVRWPLALPVVVAGIRTATVSTIGLATVAGWIDAGGLGELLFTGLGRNQPPRILAGAIAIVTIAVLADIVLRLLERATAASRAARAIRVGSG